MSPFSYRYRSVKGTWTFPSTLHWNEKTVKGLVQSSHTPLGNEFDGTGDVGKDTRVLGRIRQKVVNFT